MPSNNIKATDDIIDFDSLLNLEDSYYQEGYLEAQVEITKKQYGEGKELGIQIGFQRFVIIGLFNNLIDFLLQNIVTYVATEKNIDNNISRKGKEKNYNRIKYQLENAKKLLNIFYDNSDNTVLSVKNSDSDVENFEKILKNVKTKVKTFAIQLDFKELYNNLELSCSKITGSLPTNEINGVDEFW